jgi:hypothetical protein
MSDTTIPVVPAAVDESKAVALAKEIDPILAAAKEYKVLDLATYNVAMEMGAKCAQYSAKWDALYRDGAKMAHNLHAWFMDKIKSKCGPLEEAKGMFGKKARDWKREQDREAERIAAEKEASEKRRIEDERLRQAEALSARGKQALAEAVLEKPIEVMREKPIVVEQAKGTSDRSKWVFRITDINKVRRELLVADEKKIGQLVRALKGAFREEGIEAYDEGTTAFSRK